MFKCVARTAGWSDLYLIKTQKKKIVIEMYVFAGLTLIGLYQAGAMEDIGCSPVQVLVFSSLIVAVDPVAVCCRCKHLTLS